MVESDGRIIVELMKLHFNREINSIRQSITACALNVEVAEKLDRPVGECALHVERQYFQSSRSPTYLRTISICRGDMVQIESRFQSRQECHAACAEPATRICQQSNNGHPLLSGIVLLKLTMKPLS